MVGRMDKPTAPERTAEELRRIKRGTRIMWGGLAGFFVLTGACVAVTAVGSSPDPGQNRYEECSAGVDRYTSDAMWEHSDQVPGYVNEQVDDLRLSVIGSCMERLERLDSLKGS